MSAVDRHHDRLLALVGDADVVEIQGGFGFLEGPVWQKDRSRLIFSDIPESTMYQLVEGVVSVYRKPSDKANASAFDPAGRLVTCQHATSRVVREEADGSLTVVADAWEGRELNSPNDVIVASDGTIIFTDPTFGRQEYFGVPRPVPQARRGVYAVDPSGAIRCLANDFLQPNGLCLSADESVLFVNDTERRHIRRFDYVDGRVSGGEVWAEITGEGAGDPDGLKVDDRGNVFCTGPGGVHVFSPDGELLGVIRVPNGVANFGWGGEGLRILFFCAGSSLFSLALPSPSA
jgi:gluconolactonase